MSSLSSGGAALPWAAAPENDAAAAHDAARAAGGVDEEEDDERALPIEALGLALGGRIEVRWDIHVDGGESYSKVCVWGGGLGGRGMWGWAGGSCELGDVHFVLQPPQPTIYAQPTHAPGREPPSLPAINARYARAPCSGGARACCA